MGGTVWMLSVAAGLSNCPVNVIALTAKHEDVAQGLVEQRQWRQWPGA